VHAVVTCEIRAPGSQGASRAPHWIAERLLDDRCASHHALRPTFFTFILTCSDPRQLAEAASTGCPFAMALPPFRRRRRSKPMSSVHPGKPDCTDRQVTVVG